jgi:hypothetical protein
MTSIIIASVIVEPQHSSFLISNLTTGHIPESVCAIIVCVYKVHLNIVLSSLLVLPVYHFPTVSSKFIVHILCPPFKFAEMG